MSRSRLPIRVRDVLLIVVGVLLAVLIGVFAGIAAMMGVASLTTEPTVFLFAGSAVCATVVFVGAVVVTAGERRGGVRWWVYGVSFLIVAGLVAGPLWPMDDPRLEPAAVANRQMVELSTGSEISYVEIGASGARGQVPVVVLHGGPGVPNMKGDVDFFGQLAEDGFDVYVYDQVGSGRSGRLADPTDYGLGRDLADLDAFRRQVVRSNRLILIGHSAGARLGAAYVAEQDHRVQAFVATSPQGLRGEAGGTSLMGRLNWRERLDVLATMVHPRALTAYSVLQTSPRAAREYVGDAELDARFDRLYAKSKPALTCAGDEPVPALRGLGFYANRYPQSWSYPQPIDLRPELADAETRTLIIKGSCDYVGWASARDYRDTIADAQLVYLSDVGHNIADDAALRYLALLRAFLAERPLPDEPYTGHESPADFEGPR